MPETQYVRILPAIGRSEEEMTFVRLAELVLMLIHEQASKPAVEGQHLTKVDRSDDIVKRKEVGPKVGEAISKARNKLEPKLAQKDLAQKCNTTPKVIAELESGKGAPDQKVLAQLERILDVHLRGDNVGTCISEEREKKRSEKKSKAK